MSLKYFSIILRRGFYNLSFFISYCIVSLSFFSNLANYLVNINLTIMKYLKLIRYSFLFLLLLSACKSEEESIDNIITFKDKNFKLYSGYQFKEGATLPTGSTPFSVFLLGEGVSYNQSDEDLKGIGSLISFSVYSETSVEIKPTFYTIDIFSNDSIGYAGNCEVYYNYNFDIDTGTVYGVNAGTFDVANLGSVMKFKINLVADTILFSGVFRGPITTLE